MLGFKSHVYVLKSKCHIIFCALNVFPGHKIKKIHYYDPTVSQFPVIGISKSITNLLFLVLPRYQSSIPLKYTILLVCASSELNTNYKYCSSDCSVLKTLGLPTPKANQVAFLASWLTCLHTTSVTVTPAVVLVLQCVVDLCVY